MKIALILLNWNGKKYLKDLFESLGKVDFAQNDCDIFFVDNASTDDSLEWAKQNAGELRRKVLFIENSENHGFTGGHNIVWKKILQDDAYSYTVLLNLDTTVDSEWLKELVGTMEENTELGAAQSMILLHDQPNIINTAGNKLHYLGFGWSGHHKKPVHSNPYMLYSDEIGYASGAAVIYRNDILKKVGTFDHTYFMYHEDLELSWRIRLAGHTIVLSPKSLVYHKYEFSRNKRKWFWEERNRLVTFFSLYKTRTIILFMPPFIFMELGILVFSLVGGWFYYKIQSYVGVIKRIPYIIEKRKEIDKIRKISDKEVLENSVSRFHFAELNHPLIRIIANPILNGYFNFIKYFL